MTKTETIPIDRVHRLYGRMRTTLTQDPRPHTYKRLMLAAPGQQLRGIAAEGHVWLWPALEATHSIVREALGLTDRWGDFWIIPIGEDPLSFDWMVFESDPKRNGMNLMPGHPETQAKPDMQAVLAWFAGQPETGTSSDIEG
jgi:hypothetical protein